MPRSRPSSFVRIAGLAGVVLTATHLIAATSLPASGEMQEFALRRVLPGLLVTALFAMLAVRLGSVTKGGAIAGWVVSITIFICAGPAGFIVLATVFLLTLVATHVGATRKRRLGTAEHAGGRRPQQVLANLAVAALCSAAALVWHPWLLICMTAALAEAAADTVSSECGEAWSDRVYLVTSFERVPVGTDGGISLAGTLAGTAAAIVVVWVAYALRLVPRHGAILAAGAAVIATFFDSLLGASLQRRGRLSNSTVNFLSTIAAASIAAALVFS